MFPEEKTFTFNDLINATDIRIPVHWNKLVITNDKGVSSICFSKIEMKTVHGTNRPISVVELIVSPDLHFNIITMGKVVYPTILGIHGSVVIDVNYLENILKLLSSYNICSGYETKENVDSFVTFRDIIDVVRHNNCELLLTNKNRCAKCELIIRNEISKRKRSRENDYKLQTITYSKRSKLSRNLTINDQHNEELTEEIDPLQSQFTATNR